MRARRGFTLIDLVAVVVVLAVGGVLFAHASTPARHQAMGVVSMQNLSVIGQMSAAYVQDYNGRLPAYSWREGGLYTVYGSPGPQSFSSDSQAHGAQNTDILRRLSGRVNSPDSIRYWSSRLVARRYSHLILMDHWGFPANAPMLASPGDRNLLDWQADPVNLDGVPGSGNPPPGYESGGQTLSTRQRWAYGSSYQLAFVSWIPDASPTFGPVADTPNLFRSTGGSISLGGRRIDDVTFPSAKVWVYEEFEWRPRFDVGAGIWRSDGIWCVNNSARSAKLMFDGSVHDRPASEANSAWTPHDPGTAVWRQWYVPIVTFPAWRGDPEREIDQRFRWTREGLGGVDYTP